MSVCLLSLVLAKGASYLPLAMLKLCGHDVIVPQKVHTDIAAASVTVSGITMVMDCGVKNTAGYDPATDSNLPDESIASCLSNVLCHCSFWCHSRDIMPTALLYSVAHVECAVKHIRSVMLLMTGIKPLGGRPTSR